MDNEKPCDKNKIDVASDKGIDYDTEFFFETDTALNPSFNGWYKHIPMNKESCETIKGRVTLLAFDKTIKWSHKQ